MSARTAMLGALVLAGCVSACGKGAAPSSADAAAAAPSSSASAPPSRIAALRRAELQRDPAAVTDDDLASPAIEVRRAASRAVARAEDPRQADRLLPLLADSDHEVLSWAAFGLGGTCQANRDRIVRALVARSLSLALEAPAPPASLDPWFAIARALGACGTQEAERSLDAWLELDRSRAESAAFGLGDIATRHKRLEEESAAQLLRAASGDAARDPLDEAFFPFGRLRIQPPRAVEQELQIARTRLDHAAAARVFVVRTLARLGDDAVDDLARVLTTPASFSVADRAEAARGLASGTGRASQTALLRAVVQLAPGSDPVALTALTGASFHPLVVALDGLEPVTAAQGAPLRPMAELAVPPGAPPTLARRIAALRCGAAKALAGSNPEDPRLVACDPAHGTTGALARIAVLNRTKLSGARLAAWRAMLDDKQPVRVREAALRLLATHTEVTDPAGILAAALESPHAALVASAAEVIAQAPETAGTPSRGKKTEGRADPDPRVVQAIAAALDKERPPDDVEVVAALAKAAGVVRAAAAHKALEALCVSHQPTLRAAAAAALASIDDKKTVCEPAGKVAAPVAEELSRLIAAPVRFEVKTDAGVATLTLDPSLAPVAATRIAELAGKGFFDKNVVHRVVPGFVVQFGDPGGDGWGGSGQPPLRCETSPVSFTTGTVGMALGGRDTGSSQVFVTLAPAPHLDGHYAVIGKAEGPWDAIAEGDVIESVKRVDR